MSAGATAAPPPSFAQKGKLPHRFCALSRAEAAPLGTRGLAARGLMALPLTEMRARGGAPGNAGNSAHRILSVSAAASFEAAAARAPSLHYSCAGQIAREPKGCAGGISRRRGHRDGEVFLLLLMERCGARGLNVSRCRAKGVGGGIAEMGVRIFRSVRGFLTFLPMTQFVYRCFLYFCIAYVRVMCGLIILHYVNKSVIIDNSRANQLRFEV